MDAKDTQKVRAIRAFMPGHILGVELTPHLTDEEVLEYSTLRDRLITLENAARERQKQAQRLERARHEGRLSQPMGEDSEYGVYYITPRHLRALPGEPTGDPKDCTCGGTGNCRACLEEKRMFGGPL